MRLYFFFGGHLLDANKIHSQELEMVVVVSTVSFWDVLKGKPFTASHMSWWFKLVAYQTSTAGSPFIPSVFFLGTWKKNPQGRKMVVVKMLQLFSLANSSRNFSSCDCLVAGQKMFKMVMH